MNIRSRQSVLRGVFGLAIAAGAAFAMAAAGTEQYAYDALGRLVTVTYPNGSSVNYTYDAAGNRKTVAPVSGAGLSLSCGVPTSPNSPTAATLSCTLSNTGQTAVSSISYGAIAGISVSGPTGACGGNATCGTVTLTSGTGQGTYSGTLTATPNTGSGASVAVSMTVNPPPLTPAALSLSCGAPTSPNSPTAATMSCTVSNTGQTAVSSIVYGVPSGITYSGPSGACGGNATCGTLTLTSLPNPGTYSGTLTATPNTGSSASRTVSMTVNPSPAALSLSCGVPTSPNSPTAATLSCTLSNTGQTAISSISYGVIAGISVSGPTGACGGNATCGTVTLTSGTGQGNYNGTLTATPNTGSAAQAAITMVVNPPLPSPPSITVSRSPSPMVANANYSVTWNTNSYTTSVTYNCTSTGTGFAGSGSVPLGGTQTASGTASAAWVGYPSNCTWTATGPGGSAQATETLTTVNQIGTFSFVSGYHTARGSAGDIASATITNSGTGTITGISVSCVGGSFHNYGTVTTTLAPGASATYGCQAAASGSYALTMTLSGTNSTNGSYVLPSF